MHFSLYSSSRREGGGLFDFLKPVASTSPAVSVLCGVPHAGAALFYYTL